MHPAYTYIRKPNLKKLRHVYDAVFTREKRFPLQEFKKTFDLIDFSICDDLLQSIQIVWSPVLLYLYLLNYLTLNRTEASCEC